MADVKQLNGYAFQEHQLQQQRYPRHSQGHPLPPLVGMELLQKVSKDHDPLAYNFRDHFHEGPTVKTMHALKNKNLVLLYFGGAWCGSCQRFLPKLKAFYTQAQSAHAKVEVIYVSADRDTMEFQRTFGSMPWLAVDFESPHCRTLLTRKFHVGNIPTVVVLDAQAGDFITDSACDDITETGKARQKSSDEGGNKVDLLLAKWMTAEKVPIEDSKFAGSIGCQIL